MTLSSEYLIVHESAYDTYLYQHIYMNEATSKLLHKTWTGMKPLDAYVCERLSGAPGCGVTQGDDPDSRVKRCSLLESPAVVPDSNFI